jgi:hypothetical protein
MSLFDEILCKRKLPDDAPDFVKKCPVFQTYDLGKGMGQFTITESGELICESTMISGMLENIGFKFHPVPIKYVRKKIEMHASNLRGGAPGRGKNKGRYINYTENGEDYISIVYVVQIRNGRVSSIKEKWRDVKPARPLVEMK